MSDEHHQLNLNRALHQRAVAEARLRLAGRVYRMLDHELDLKLARTKVVDQLAFLRDVENRIATLLVTE